VAFGSDPRLYLRGGVNSAAFGRAEAGSGFVHRPLGCSNSPPHHCRVYVDVAIILQHYLNYTYINITIMPRRQSSIRQLFFISYHSLHVKMLAAFPVKSTHSTKASVLRLSKLSLRLMSTVTGI